MGVALQNTIILRRAVVPVGEGSTLTVVALKNTLLYLCKMNNG